MSHLEDLCETGRSSLILESLLDFVGTRGLATVLFSSKISDAINRKKEHTKTNEFIQRENSIEQKRLIAWLIDFYH
jgi:hypothetical protein